jgi:hypothetical protein
MTTPNRREFQTTMLSTLAGNGLLEFLWQRDLFADEVKPLINDWFKSLYELGQDLHGTKIKDVEFQKQLEALYKKVDLASLVKFVDLSRIEERSKLPENGAFSAAFDLSKVEGLPPANKLGFGKQIFCLKKGRSIVPHGHMNMCTGFIVLKGEFRGRLYDRLETLSDSYIIKPSIDETFKAGGVSSISDHKDNIHWFEALSETGFVFNLHFTGYDKTIKESSGRLYLDPDGEKLDGGKIKAKKLNSAECHKKYG